MMMMIDTLMALWNQDRRKRARQILLVFLLLCISISVLFVLLKPAQSQHQNQKAAVSTATVPPFGNTVVPNLTPTLSVVVGTQPTPVPTTQPTPAPTTQTPCSTTPSGATSNGLSVNVDIQGSSPTTAPTASNTSTPYVPRKHNDGGGGGVLLPGVTPTFSVPTTPSASSTATPGTQSGGNGWGSNCATSNSILNSAGQNVLATIAENIWFILGGSLLCTVLFYGAIFMVKRRIM
jgi:hypothetical protein